MQRMEELKKCPFCGGEAILYKSFDYVNKCRVECTNCNICTQNYDTKGEAIEAWNRRVKE
jgi:Lar family restriction alleviation protein